MNSTFFSGQRNFSFSSYHTQSQSPFQLSQYINPDSTRAHQALLVHHQSEQQNSRRFEDSYKTVMCENWLEKAQCSFGKNCRFAHGFEDIRQSNNPPPINAKYKTRLCDKYTKRGICPYGNRCLFIHPEMDNPSFGPTSSPQIAHRQRSPIQSLLSWTPSVQNPPPPPPTPLLDSDIPPFSTPSSIFAANSSSFAHSFPMVLPRAVHANNQNQRMMMANFERNRPNKGGRNLFPQILEELQREKENSTPTPSTQIPQGKKWSDLEEPEVDAYDHEREMERIVEKLVASPMMMNMAQKVEDCQLT